MVLLTRKRVFLSIQPKYQKSVTFNPKYIIKKLRYIRVTESKNQPNFFFSTKINQTDIMRSGCTVTHHATHKERDNTMSNLQYWRSSSIKADNIISAPSIMLFHAGKVEHSQGEIVYVVLFSGAMAGQEGAPICRRRPAIGNHKRQSKLWGRGGR